MAEQQGVTGERIFKMLMESQYWSPTEMPAYHRSQLEQLLRHAKASVPFYETRLDCLFRHDGTIDWSRWKEVPMLTRTDLRDNGSSLKSVAPPPHHGGPHITHTSGSSGIPVSIITAPDPSHIGMPGLNT